MRTRIKVCGLTREADLDEAVEAGVDAIGLVFYDKSPRAVSIDTAQRLVRRLPAWVAAVGLFVNSPRDEVRRIADSVGLSHLQLHGDETPEECLGLGRPVVKALRIRNLAKGDMGALSAETRRVEGLLDQYSACQAILFDSDSQGFGGSGQSFDWRIVQEALANAPLRRATWVLSGGLESGSVARAIAELSAPCVDVSSGVERLEAGLVVKGQKDADRIKAFVSAVRAADQLPLREI
jgi:phosphoribosylanthranilate isomerase